MIVEKSPDAGTVIRNRMKYVMKAGWATPAFVGDFIPGLKIPLTLKGEGPFLERMAKAAIQHSPKFLALGLTPKELATGLELGEVEESLRLADPRGRESRLGNFRNAVRTADDKALTALQSFAAEGAPFLGNDAAKGSKKSAPESADVFHTKASGLLEGPLQDFSHVFSTLSVQTLLADLDEFSSVFKKVQTPTRDAYLAVIDEEQRAMVSGVETRAAEIRSTFEEVSPAFVAGVAYALNAGFSGEFLAIHVPKTMAPAKVAAYVIQQLIEAKQRCYDVVLLNPIPDASVLTTHWASYFTGDEIVQATIFASLEYKTLDDLGEKAAATKLQSGSAAAHFFVSAGFGTLLGRRCPVGPAIAGARHKRDTLINPLGRYFGVLESSFGPQDDKAIFGFEAIDALELRDPQRARFAKRGINTVTETDGLVHPFRATSLSSDLTQYDATRAANWFIGSLRKFMGKVTIGQCSDPTFKAMIAKEATESLNAPFRGKGDFEIVVTPGESLDPRDFQLTLGIPEIAFIETFTIFVELVAPKKK